MSKRPYMQVYVSDFVGDTMQLSTEGIGAYWLLLMAAWNAGGYLPSDDRKLAHICRMTLRKFRAVKCDIMPFFDECDGMISQKRQLEEIQKVTAKSKINASSGARGGEAKALKNNKPGLANASDSLGEKASITINQNHISKKDNSYQSYPKKKSERDGGDDGKKSVKRGSRLPDDWWPSSAGVGYAAERGYCQDEIRDIAESYRDYWHAKSGKDAAKLDWDATWRNWIRNNRRPPASKRSASSAVHPAIKASVAGTAQALAEWEQGRLERPEPDMPF